MDKQVNDTLKDNIFLFGFEDGLFSLPSEPGCSFASVWVSSDFTSVPSACVAKFCSGAGLELLLFSCFIGEASAIELWLLLSSVNKSVKTMKV